MVSDESAEVNKYQSMIERKCSGHQEREDG